MDLGGPEQLRILRPKKGDILVVRFDNDPSISELDGIIESFRKIKLDDPTLRIPIIFEYPNQHMELKNGCD